uniref:Uncharacterized protein n=1 Tax=Ceratitis capitata TaxID=7213 RepID=W8BFS7_CERCA
MPRFTATRQKLERREEKFSTPCRLCGKNHGVRLCPMYRKKSAEERLRAVLIHKYCANCLSPFHKVEICSSKYRCQRCNEKHHTTLHMEEETTNPTVTVVDEEDSEDSALSIDVTDQYKSWAQLVEEEEEEERLVENPAPSGSTELRRFRPLLRQEQACLADDGAETRPFRLSVPPHRHGRQDGVETRPFRPSVSTRRLYQQDGAETRSFRPSHRKSRDQQHRGAETRPFRPSHHYGNRTKPYSRQKTSLLTLQRLPSEGFRSGRITQGAAPPPIMRSFVAIAPTAIVPIEASGRLHLVRALIDPCAPTSTIDMDLARELQLERRQTWCSIILRGKYGITQRVTTQAKIAKRYCRLSPAANIDPAVTNGFQFMRLADSTFHRSTPTRLTLGADVYAQIMVGSTPPSTVGGLMAQPSIFGLIISGAAQT